MFNIIIPVLLYPINHVQTLDTKKNMQTGKVTICACASRTFIDKEKIAAIAATMRENGHDVTIEADICRKVMDNSPDMPNIAEGIIMACHPRAVRSLLAWREMEPKQLIDIRNTDCDRIFSSFTPPYPKAKDDSEKAGFLQQIRSFPIESGTDAWYPVIDKTRCTECGKCHDFCLFGVYAIENKQVKVVQPQNCKNNCPACARMCPSKAIIFPKYEKSPINGGTEEEETFHPEEMDAMYRERLRMRLQERRAGVSLFKKDEE